MMKRTNRWIVLVVAVAGLGASACSGSPVADPTPGPAAVEPIEGTDLVRVTLSEQAVARVGIKTAPVTAADAGQTIVPTAAVLYDVHGATWVYTNTEGRSYQRASITVAGIKGDEARLSAGPSPGTAVVTVGVAELFGTETGVGEPE
jgi:hypothetical protein